MRPNRRIMQTRVIPAIITVFFACAGCVSEPASAGSMAVIGPEGGTVELAYSDGVSARIEIPRGALVSDVEISVGFGEIHDLPYGMREMGPVVRFGPDGQHFSTPVDITIPAFGEPLVLYTRPSSGGGWTVVEGARWDAARRVMTAAVAHFSDFVAATRFGAACDVFANVSACTAGLACVPIDSLSADGMCVDSMGTVREGHCRGSVGECAPGLGCNAPLESGAPTGPGRCMPYCDDTHPCGSGEDCVYDGRILWGVCRTRDEVEPADGGSGPDAGMSEPDGAAPEADGGMPRQDAGEPGRTEQSQCDIFAEASECASGLTCVPINSLLVDGMCQRLADTPIARGGECAQQHLECAPGLGCNAPLESGAPTGPGRCMPYCNEGHPCGADEECVRDGRIWWGICRAR